MTSIRSIKRRAHGFWGTQPFDHEDTHMPPIRHVKPCRSYNHWCSDCNAVRFRREFNRFPRNYAEFADMEDVWQGEEQ